MRKIAQFFVAFLEKLNIIRKYLPPLIWGIYARFEKKIADSSELILSLTLHQGHKPYQCSMCKMTFSKTFLLEQHIQEFHEKRRPFDCEVCQKKFFRKKHLFVHKTSTYHKKRVAWSEKENKENLAPKNLSKNSLKNSSSKPSVTEVFIKESNQEKFEESGNVFNEKNDDEQNSTKQNISKGDILMVLSYV